MMERMRVALLLPVLAGCVVVPKTVTRTTTDREESAQMQGAEGPLQLTFAAAGRDLRVRALRPRTCRRDVIEVTTTTREREPDLEVPDLGHDSSGYGAVLVLAFSVVTLPVSGLITAAVLHDDKPETTQQRYVVDQIERACPVRPAAIPVELVLPSGAVLVETTNSDGEVAFHVPDTEPTYGVVTARAEGATATARYHMMTKSCSICCLRASSSVSAMIGSAISVASPSQVFSMRSLPSFEPARRIRRLRARSRAVR
jgi:hypothetical protein